MVDYGATSKGYGKLWDDCKITDGKQSQLLVICGTIVKNKEVYQDIEKKTGVPWFWIGPIHTRESDNNFRTHLHNGDSLRDYTHHVPAGRPQVGHEPPFTFAESAVDALEMSPHQLQKVSRWSVERMLYEMEKYNGFGYLRHEENSPYVWGMTSEQQSGKYVADGQYSSAAWDSQPGTAAILMTLATLDPEVASRLKDREGRPPPEVVKSVTGKGRKIAGGGGAIAGGGGLVGTTQDTSSSTFLHASVPWAVFGVGLALLIVGGVIYAKKKQLLQLKWIGRI